MARSKTTAATNEGRRSEQVIRVLRTELPFSTVTPSSSPPCHYPDGVPGNWIVTAERLIYQGCGVYPNNGATVEGMPAPGTQVPLGATYDCTFVYADPVLYEVTFTYMHVWTMAKVSNPSQTFSHLKEGGEHVYMPIDAQPA